MTALDWMGDALCAQLVDADEIFYPPKTGAAATKDAKAICATCPVQAECRDYAFELEEGVGRFHRYGVWAGTTPVERFDLQERRAAS